MAKKKKSSKKKKKASTTPAAPVLTAVAPAAYTAPTYTSKYQNQINEAMNKVTNREAFSYDPLKDASYQALAKVYNARGELAAKDSLGDAAALNGGYGSSYATTASAQARAQYNEELAALVPELEQQAYARYSDAFNMDMQKLSALQGAEEFEYGKYRDTVGDSQWSYSQNYQKYRDTIADQQWTQEFHQQKINDAINNAYTKKQTKLLGKSSSSGGGGGGGRRGGSGGGSYSSGGSSSGSSSIWQKANQKAKQNASKKKGGTIPVKTAKQSTKYVKGTGSAVKKATKAITKKK